MSSIVVVPYPLADEAGVKEDTLEFPFGRVRVQSGGTGEVLVVLHREIGAFGWTPFHRELALDFDVRAISMPGFDGSDRPDFLRNVSQLAVLVGHILDSMRLTAVRVLGLGFGGWVAAELMTLHPSRVGAALLQAPTGVKPTPGEEVVDQFLLAAPEYVRLGFADETTYAQLYGDELSEDQLFTWELNRETFTRIGWKPYMYNPALPHLLRLVDAPVLLVRGTEDRIVPPSCLDGYMASLPNANVQEVDGGGHLLELDRPTELARGARDFFAPAI